MDVQNIQPKINSNTTVNLKHKQQLNNQFNLLISKSICNQQSVESQQVYVQNLPAFGVDINSPSFGGLFSRNEPYSERPYRKKLFSPLLIHKDSKVFVNTSKPAEVVQILKEKYFSYDKDYKYEVLTEENKKPLTNGQVEILNGILNNRNCINLFNIKDFDYVLKHKDKGFVAACFNHEIQPTKVKPSLINIFKKLNDAIDEKGKQKYSNLSLSDIENVTEENFEFFDKVYKYTNSGRFLGGYRERQALLQHIEKASKLIDFAIKSNVVLNGELSCKVLYSEHFDKWMNILNELQILWETDKRKSGYDGFYGSYFNTLDKTVESEKYNPVIVDEVLKEAKNRNIDFHKKVLLDENLANEILKKFNQGYEDDAVFMMWTGQRVTPEIKIELAKLREKRELTKDDYAVFEYALNNDVKSSIVDVIENKPNLASVVARVQDINRVYSRFSSEIRIASKTIFERKNDYTEDETNVIHRLLNEHPIDSNPIIFDCLEKIGYLNDSLFELNYDLANILFIIIRTRKNKKDSVDNEIIKKILDANICECVFPIGFFNTYKGVLLKRLELLKEISELAPEYMPIIDMSSDTVEESCKFLKAALGCGLDKKLIELGLEFKCGPDGIEKLNLINKKSPELFYYCMHKDLDELDLAESYAQEDILKKHGSRVVDFSLYERISVDNVPDIAELYGKSEISTNEIKKIIKFARRNRHELRKLSLKKLNEFLNYQLSSSVNETRLGKEILADGGVKGIISSIIEEKISGKKFIKPINEKAQGELFYNLSFDKLYQAFEKFDVNDYKNQRPFTLSYPRDKFVSDLCAICEDYYQKDVDKVLEFLDFSLDLGNDFAKSNYEIPLEFSLTQKYLCEKLNKQIDKFIYENKVVVSENPQMEKLLNSIIAFFPEFISVIGKKQHATHNYTVDVHTLKVLQECVNNPEYQNLSAKEQAILSIAVLLHDLGKSEGIVDEGHYKYSAILAKNIFEKLKINDEMKERIYNLIENHHWLGNLQKGYATPDEVASAFRFPCDYKLAKIFAKADLKGVSDDFYSMCSSALTGNNVQNVEKILDNIHSTNPILFTSKILPNANIKKIDGVKVIDIVNGDNNLTEIFGKDVKNEEDLKFLVHMIEDARTEKFVNLKALCTLGNSANLSTSYVAYNNNPTYCNYKYGIVVDVPHFNILLVSKRNNSTGCKKDEHDMVVMLNPYGDSNLRKKHIELLKYELGVDDDEYGQIYRQVSSCKKKSEIKDIKIGERIIKKGELLDAISVFEKSFLSKSQHNEIVVYNPKMSGLIAMVDKYDEVPKEMRKFAQKYDLPIIILGENMRY